MIVYTDRHHVAFQIDADDYEVVRRYFWWIGSNGYPMTAVGKTGTNRRLQKELHSFLLGRAPDGLEWDHRDRDRKNNQRSNLRAVTKLVNLRNHGPQGRNTSGILGVSWNRAQCRWVAYIGDPKGSGGHLGTFRTIEEAAAARSLAEKELWGDAR